MIGRVLVLAGGVLGGAAASQFPEYSQQYAQRLGGAVDALEQVVVDFDASAAASDPTRAQALAQMQGTPFLDRRRGDMERTFQRYDRLKSDLEVLTGAGPFLRAYHATRLTDGEVAQAAMAAYQPAVPLNFAGLTFAGTGFLAGLIGVWATLRLLLWPVSWRRRRSSRA